MTKGCFTHFHNPYQYTHDCAKVTSRKKCLANDCGLEEFGADEIYFQIGIYQLNLNIKVYANFSLLAMFDRKFRAFVFAHYVHTFCNVSMQF